MASAGDATEWKFYYKGGKKQGDVTGPWTSFTDEGNTIMNKHLSAMQCNSTFEMPHAYRNPRGKHKNMTYTMDLIAMQQINPASHTTRPIRGELGAGGPAFNWDAFVASKANDTTYQYVATNASQETCAQRDRDATAAKTSAPQSQSSQSHGVGGREVEPGEARGSAERESHDQQHARMDVDAQGESSAQAPHTRVGGGETCIMGNQQSQRWYGRGHEWGFVHRHADSPWDEPAARKRGRAEYTCGSQPRRSEERRDAPSGAASAGGEPPTDAANIDQSKDTVVAKSRAYWERKMLASAPQGAEFHACGSRADRTTS